MYHLGQYVVAPDKPPVIEAAHWIPTEQQREMRAAIDEWLGRAG